MRSRRDDVEPVLAVERALEHGLVGMGRVDDDRAERRLRRFAEVTTGAEVWTRHPDGRFHRGRVAGPLVLDESAEAELADLVHVRACAWDDEGLEEHEVPAAVAATFRRGGRNFQRIRAL